MKKLSLSIVIALLAACSTGKPVNRDIEFGGQYWQKVNASEAIYMRGPKAQQMLNRDISHCVVELRELERLGQLRNAIPTTFDERVLDPDENELRHWDAPERDGYLRAEHLPYHDFEGCMLDKGWERVLHVPYAVAKEARRTYMNNLDDHAYQTRHGYYKPEDYGELNN